MESFSPANQVIFPRLGSILFKNAGSFSLIAFVIASLFSESSLYLAKIAFPVASNKSSYPAIT